MKRVSSKNKRIKKVTKGAKTFASSWFLRNVLLAIAILIVIFIAATFYLNNYTRHGERYVIPDYSGMSIEEANNFKPEMNIRFDIKDSIYTFSVPPGAIIDQYPKPGNYVKSGRRIVVTVNTNTPKSVKIPYIAGYSLRQAKNRLLGAGLRIGTITFEQDIATNNVLRQLYNGEEVTSKSNIETEVGSKIDLVVGMNDDSSIIKIDNFIGKNYYEVCSFLWENGLNVQTSYNKEDISNANIDRSTIYAQLPMPSDSLKYGDVVTLKISTDTTLINQGVNAMNLRYFLLDSLSVAKNIYTDSLSYAKYVVDSIAQAQHMIDSIKMVNYINNFVNPTTDIIQPNTALDSLKTDGMATDSLQTEVMIKDTTYYVDIIQEIEIKLDSIKQSKIEL